MTTIAVIDMDMRSTENSQWRDRVERIDCYALASTELARYAVLIVTSTVDQEHLARYRGVIRNFLEGVGVVIFGGHLHRDWLPGAAAFVPLTERSLATFRVVEVADHPIFRGIEPDELTFRCGSPGSSRAGTIRFLRARRCSPALPAVSRRRTWIGCPPRAPSWCRRVVICWATTATTPGTLIVATLDPISHYGSYFMPATERFLDGFLPWAAQSGTNRRCAATPHPSSPA
jgi:hypothetical protein